MVRLLLIAGFTSGLLVSTSLAADLVIPDESLPMMEEADGFDWAGFYAGVQAGVQHYPEFDRTYGLVGAHAGFNFLATESILLGLEASAELIWDETAGYGEFFGSGRVGVLATEQLLLYGIAGAGTEVAESGDRFGTYHFGVGAEAAVDKHLTVRGQVVSVGFLDDANGSPGVKATMGVSFHF